MYDIIDSAIFTHLWVWTVVLITLVMCGFCVDWLLSVLWRCQLAPVCQSTAPLITKRFLETLAGHLADPRKWETGDKTVMCVCVCVHAAGVTRAVWRTVHVGIDGDGDNDDSCQRGTSSWHCWRRSYNTWGADPGKSEAERFQWWQPWAGSTLCDGLNCMCSHILLHNLRSVIAVFTPINTF